MAYDIAVPSQLPCLVLQGQVLLPSSFARISFGLGHRRSTALLEHLSSMLTKDIYVVVIPCSKDDDPEGRSLSRRHVGCIATCARVLQLSKMVQSGDWVLLLEGVCRVLVEDVMMSEDPEEEYDCVAVSQLEMRPPGAPLPVTGTGGPFPASDSMAGDVTPGLGVPGAANGAGGGEPTVAELGKQLKVVTRALLRQLTRQVNTAQSRRMIEVLGSVPPWRAADVVAAALATSYQERLSVLHAVDHKLRIKLALSLAQSTLEALRAGGGVMGGHAGSRGGGPLTAWSGGVRSGTGGSSGARQGVSSPSSWDSSAGADPAEEDTDGLDALMTRLTAARPPPEVARAAAKEYKKLKQAGESTPGYAAARSYLETLADLPWSKTSADLAAAKKAAAADAPSAASGSGGSGRQEGTGTLGNGVGDGGDSALAAAGPLAAVGEAPASLRAARQVLDRQHYGLEKIKDRVIEYLAVLRLKGTTARAPILCFIGPPGVGKTSLARSVAEVLGRPFVRIALGGVRDEAEIRGHRRTYVGAMPGRILTGLRRAGVNDPVMLLDELDKLGKDAVRGDPAAALLEVLDPEQNSHFTDAYLGLPCDLSSVTFVATANRAADIPAPLLDRLEVISLGGYTLEEKIHIAQQHLLPKTLDEHGLSPRDVQLDDSVLEFITDRYTREAGVRNLSRCLAALCRHVAVSIVSQHESQDDPQGPASHPAEPMHAHTDPSMAQQAPAAAVNTVHGEAHMSSLLQQPSDSQGSTLQSLADLSEAPLNPFLPSTLFANPHHATHQDLSPPQSQSQQPPLPLPASTVAPAQSSSSRASWLFPWQRQTHSSAAQHSAGSHGSARHKRAAQEVAVSSGGGSLTQQSPLALLRTHGAVLITEQLVEEVLGPPRYGGLAEASEAVTLPGAAAGLVWTAVGGSVQYIECARISYGSPGRHGNLTLTGQVGEVLEESARIALSWIRANAAALGLPPLAANARHSSDGGADDAGIGPARRRAQQQRVSDDGDYDDMAATGTPQPRWPRRPAPTHMSKRATVEALVRAPCSSQLMGSVPVASGGQALQEPAGSLAAHQPVVIPGDPVTDMSPSGASEPPLPGGVLSHGGGNSPLCWDVHVHLPAGAIPKDGPSAGITLAVALVSLLTGRVVRADTAMTGELTLRGLVLPVGGIKEKLLAARHAGMSRVIVPARNMRDVVADVPAATRAALTIIPAERLEQVLAAAFDPPFTLLPPPPLPSRL